MLKTLVKILIVLWGDWPWLSRLNLTLNSKFTPIWNCLRNNLSSIEARTTKFGQEMQNTLVNIPIVLEIDSHWQVIFNFYFKILFICITFAFLKYLWDMQKRNLLNCSSSHMALHIYWFPIRVQAAIDSAIGAGFYKLLSVFAKSHTPHMPKFYMPTFGNHRNNSKTVPLSLYFVRLPSLG